MVVRGLVGRIHWVWWVWTWVVGWGIGTRIGLLGKHWEIHILARIIFVFIINWFFLGLFFSFLLFLLFHSGDKWGRGAVNWGSKGTIQGFVTVLLRLLFPIFRWFLNWWRGPLRLGWSWSWFRIIVSSVSFLKESIAHCHEVLV